MIEISMLTYANFYVNYIKEELSNSSEFDDETKESINNEIDKLPSPFNLEENLKIGYFNILAAKLNSNIDLKDFVIVLTKNKIPKVFKDTRWIRNLHKLKIAIDIVKSNIPETLEQSSTAPKNIDMKKLLLNSIDNLHIFCKTYLGGTIGECLKISMQDITTTTQSADMALQLISSVDEKKIISLVSNMYLIYRETLELIPEEIVVNEVSNETIKNPIEGAITDKPIVSNTDKNIPNGLGGILQGMSNPIPTTVLEDNEDAVKVGEIKDAEIE